MRRFSRVILIGDVHGCIEELEELVQQLEIRTTDQVILLGDLIGKGPSSRECIEFVRSRSFVSLLGNHEYLIREKMRKHYQRDNASCIAIKESERRLFQSLQKHQSWLDTLTPYYAESKFMAVHAGFIPSLGLEQTPLHWLLNIREWPMEQPWFYNYTGNKPVYFGHWAQLGYARSHNCTCLDSGCVYGGSLSATILFFSDSTSKIKETMLVQIPAKKIHCPISAGK